MKISYNPITYNTRFSEVEFESNGQCLQIINENNNEIRISNWFTSFLEKHIEDFNESEFEFIFESTNEEVVLINNVVQNYNVRNSTSIKLVPSIKEINNGNEVLKSLLDTTNSFVNNTSDDIFTKREKQEIKENIVHINREVPVVIMAPMSAGKSTLINAILGQELLPSENQACTATICRIKDIDDKEGFDAIVKDEKGKVIYKKNNIDLSYLEEINKKGNNEQIEITLEGDIKGVSSDSMNLLLIDTPGPNNSQNDKHKEVTYSYLKDNTKNALIIYVLNATQLSTNDDKSILQEISQVVKNNKSIDDRILFVLNRVDDLKIKKEPLDVIVDKCRSYLEEDFGIVNPKIFPMSAEYAKLSSLQNNSNIDEDDLDQLEFFRKKLTKIDTLSHTPISVENKNKLLNQSEKAEYDIDMINSGLAALKFYINDYINKTHKTIASHEIIERINPILKKKLRGVEIKLTTLEEEIKLTNINIKSNLIDSKQGDNGLLSNKKEVEKMIKNLRKELEEKKAKKQKHLTKLNLMEKKFNMLKPTLKKQVDQLPTTGSINYRLKAQINVEFNKIMDFLSKEEVTPAIANAEIRRVEAIISNLDISLKTTINEEFIEIINDTKKKIEGLIKNNFRSIIKEIDFSIESQQNIDLSIDTNLRDVVVEEGYISNSRMVKKKKRVSDSHWYNPFSYGRTKIIYVSVREDYTETYKYVNLKEIYRNKVQKVKPEAFDMLEKAINIVELDLSKIKKNSGKLFELVDDIIEELKNTIHVEISEIVQNKKNIVSKMNHKKTIVKDINISKRIIIEEGKKLIKKKKDLEKMLIKLEKNCKYNKENIDVITNIISC